MVLTGNADIKYMERINKLFINYVTMYICVATFPKLLKIKPK